MLHAIVVGLLLSVAQAGAPAAAAPPGVASADERARWRTALAWPDDCESQHQSAVKLLELNDGRVRVFDLGGRRSLVEVGCARGAYQDSLLYYLYDESRTPPQVTRLALPSYEAVDDEWEPTELTEATGAASFDTARKLLTLRTLARGLGDCGSIARYRVQGTKLVLVDFRGRGCDGEPENAPPAEKWPRVFPK